MSVAEKDVVDGIAIGHDGETLIMEIYDHLNFEDEFKHIAILQDKLNTYIWFINSKQYSDLYPNTEFKSYLIIIHFLHELSDNSKKFVNESNKALVTSDIVIATCVSE